jgi:hypothetical protein
MPLGDKLIRPFWGAVAVKNIFLFFDEILATMH